MFLTITISLILQLITPIISRIFQGKLFFFIEKLKNFRFTNYWLGFFNETYLFMSICTAINFGLFSFYNFANAVNSIFTFVFAFLLVCFTIFVGVFYSRNENIEKIIKRDPKFLIEYGSVAKDLNFKRKGKSVVFFALFCLFRKLLLAYLLVF